MPFATNVGFVGIAKETVKGTAVTPADYIPVETGNLQLSDRPTYMDDAALRGAMVDVFDQVQGLIWSEHALSGPIYPDTFGYLLAGITGDVVTTGASAPFSHVMCVNNATTGQCPSYTLTQYYGFAGTHSRQYAGCQVSEIAIKFTADNMIHHDTKLTGFAAGALVAKPTQSFTTVPATPVWRGTLTIGGSSKTFLMDGTLTLKRNVTPIPGFLGTQAPYAIWQGPLQIDGQLMFIIEDDAEEIRMLTNTQPAVVLDWQNGAGAALTELKLQMTKTAYTVGDKKYDKDFPYIQMTVKGVGNTTDVGASGGYSNVKATIQSAKPASTYA